MPRPTLYDHPKFHRAAHELKIPRPHLLGYLEYIWRVGYASGEPIIGDSVAIELAAEWKGKRGRLTEVLLMVGFLDKTDNGLYAIHDLHDNAPDYVHSRYRMERKRKRDSEQSVTVTQPLRNCYAPPAPAPAPAPAHTNTRALSTACPKAEIPPSGPPSPMLEVLLTFPVVGEPNKTWDFTAGNRDTLAMGYPHLDIMAEVRKALVWIDANAPNRKTARGMKSCLNRWMNKAQNNGHPLAYSKVPRGTFTPEEEAGIDADIRARHEGNGQ